MQSEKINGSRLNFRDLLLYKHYMTAAITYLRIKKDGKKRKKASLSRFYIDPLTLNFLFKE